MKYFQALIIVLLGLLVYPAYTQNEKTSPILGTASDIYSYSTTTDSTWNSTTNPTRFRVLKTGQGVLGSVIITGATSVAELRFYDATTTASHADHATTTLYVNNVSTPANDYGVNIPFSRGLIVEFPSTAGAASSTITWR